MENDLRVVVIGGGIGGLCLAQGLKKAGVKVSVYERDRTQWSRLQGFRIHIDPDGSTALHQCLPENLWEVFASTCGDFSQGFTMLNERLEELMKFRHHAASQDPVARHRSVSRMTLRQVLLGGLGGAIHFDKRFDRYEPHADGRIVAFFEDGSTAEGDVLVAADGVNSRVRQQYLPGNDPVDTGVVGLGGRIPLTDGIMAMLPPCLLDGPAMVLPSGPANLFLAAWRRSSEATDRVLALLDVKNGDAPEGDAAAVDEKDYVILALGAKREYFGLSPDVVSMTPGEMKQLLRSKMRDWHPDLRKLAEMTTDELGLVRIRTSEPVAPWQPSNVTLLGDAIHSMTPYRGIGANVALRDAALLCAKLDEAVASGSSPVEKIGQYEAEMRDYGFAAVAESRKSMNQAVGKKKIAFRVGMSAMRIVNRVPALRERVFEQMAGNPRRSVTQTS